MQFNQETYTFTDPGRFGRIMLIVGLVGLVLSAVGIAVDAHQFFASYLVNFTFWATLGIGGLFFVLVHHLTGAVWSVVIRRIGEAAMATLPMVALLAIPMLLGLSHTFSWTDSALMNGDPLLKAKSGYLNIPFFVIRTVVYIGVWILLAQLLRRYSLALDNGWQESATSKFIRISGPGTIAFAFTLSFAGFDWIMSLQPLWYSTIFGLWFFSGAAVMIYAFFALTSHALAKKGILAKEISTEHRHDIGKLLFTFMVFWAYMALSQYLLIWYANMPEETAFFKARWVGSWKTLSVLYPVVGFVIPFVLMMSRHIKRNRWFLSFWAIWLVLFHWIDLYWNIIPTFHPEHVVFSWMDLTLFVGMGGLMLWRFWAVFTKHPVLPLTDPKLHDSVEFVNQ